MRRQNCLLAKDSGQTLQTCSSAMTFLDFELYHFFQDADGAGAKGFKQLKKLAIQERTNRIAAGTSPGSSSGDAGGLHCTMQRLGCGIPGSRGSLIAICLCSFPMISSTTC